MIETIIGNFNLERIFYIIKKRLFLMIIIGAIGGMAVGYYSFSTSYELYSARVTMYIYSDPNYIYDPTVNVSNADLIKAKNLVPSYMLVLKSNTVLEKVIENLGAPYTVDEMKSMINSGAVDDTAVFYVSVATPDPSLSMEIANAIAEIAPEEISRVVKSGGVEVIDYATLPDEPFYKTNVIKYTLVGLVGGFGLSFMIFLFFGLLDRTIRKRHEISDTFTIPILGDVPTILRKSRKNPMNKLLSIDSTFDIKESYNIIRTNLTYLNQEESCPTYVVTSADMSEGKTLNCVNIAVSFAMMGKKVLVIDADLRSPSVERLFVQHGLQSSVSEHGLNQFLAEVSESYPVYQFCEGNLSVIPAGDVLPNPAELLSSSVFASLLETLKESYDYIFIDTPPVGIVSDALVVKDLITSYILVARSNVSKMNEQLRVVKHFGDLGALICGFIYNEVDPKSNEYVYKHYKNAYSPDTKKKKNK